MNAFEEKLRTAMRRINPPQGFAEKVLARTESLPKPGAKGWRPFSFYLSKPLLRWAVVGATICMLIVAAMVHQRRQEHLRKQGEMARVQVMQALRIASVKLNLARQRVEEVGREASPSHM
jgi:hypothetical protein